MKLYTRSWLPETPVHAAVILVHGLGEHCARYDHVASAFNANGIALYGFDHRGHGRSPGVRGHIPSLETVREDIGHFIAKAKNAHPGIPVFLYGHSMGGLLVLDYCLVCNPDINGVICSAPALSTGDPVTGVKLLAGKVLYFLVPSFTMPNGLDVQNLSRDPMVVKAYTSDPLVTSQVSARLGLDLINRGPWVLNHTQEWTLPVLLMQGTKDHIVSAQATARFASVIPQNLLKFKEWQGFYHEIHNEFGKEQVIQEMLDWIDHQIGV